MLSAKEREDALRSQLDDLERTNARLVDRVATLEQVARNMVVAQRAYLDIAVLALGPPVIPNN